MYQIPIQSTYWSNIIHWVCFNPASYKLKSCRLENGVQDEGCNCWFPGDHKSRRGARGASSPSAYSKSYITNNAELAAVSGNSS